MGAGERTSSSTSASSTTRNCSSESALRKGQLLRRRRRSKLGELFPDEPHLIAITIVRRQAAHLVAHCRPDWSAVPAFPESLPLRLRVTQAGLEAPCCSRNARTSLRSISKWSGSVGDSSKPYCMYQAFA